MVLYEGVHVVDEQLDWGLLDDGGPVVLVDGVLEEEDHEDEHLLETPGVLL